MKYNQDILWKIKIKIHSTFMKLFMYKLPKLCRKKQLLSFSMILTLIWIVISYPKHRKNQPQKSSTLCHPKSSYHRRAYARLRYPESILLESSITSRELFARWEKLIINNAHAFHLPTKEGKICGESCLENLTAGKTCRGFSRSSVLFLRLSLWVFFYVVVALKF